MTSRLVTLRNVVVVVGAYYLTAWSLIPVWFPLLKASEGRIWNPQLQGAINLLPSLCAAALAGVVFGWLIVSVRPKSWAIGAGAFVALMEWSSVHRYVPPALSDVLEHGSRSVVVGGIAGITCWIVMRRSGKRVEPVAAA